MPGVTTAYQNGIHSARPAANAGCILYACSTHSLIYRSDGSTWTTWMTIGSTTTTVASDAIWDAKGDLAAGTGADTAAKLTAGSNGMVPVYDSAQSTGLKTAYPPGYEFDYVAATSDTSITATSQATANTVVTGASVTYDGSTTILIEFFGPDVDGNGGTGYMRFHIFDGSSAISNLALAYPSGGAQRWPVFASQRITPSAAAHTYSIRADVQSSTGTVRAGTGTSGGLVPAFMRITKV